MSGQKIIDGLKQAVAGDFSRVTIDGQTWIRVPPRELSEEQRTSIVLSIQALTADLHMIESQAQTLRDAIKIIQKRVWP